MSEQDDQRTGFFKIGKHWPWVIVGMLVVHASIILGTIAVVSARHDLYVEPDYYAKAIDWDNQRAMREMADTMGWTIELAVYDEQVDSGTGRQALEVSIRDRDNQPIDGALVQAEAVHPAHANDRINLVLLGIDDGRYRKPIEMEVPGFWQVHLAIRYQGIQAMIQREIEIRARSAEEE